MLARKRWRDLWQLRAQLLAVVLVAAVGVANLVMSRATLDSLQSSRDRYYRENAFADVFVDLKRAPLQVARQLRAIPGVAVVDTRIVTFGRAEIESYDEPIAIQVLSAPMADAAALNRIHLRSGRIPEPADRNSLVVSDGFAQAHRLRIGHAITLILHGRRQSFRIVGIGATPEFVAQMPPQAAFPDARRFAVAWLQRPSLEAATDMEGAFNSATLALSPGGRMEAVLADVDRVLGKYGGVGATGREDQRSHRYLSEELRQLRTMAKLFPAVFLSVAAFVLYVVLGRLVSGQREQIGTLKAFGYERGEILRHYAGFAVLVGLLGGTVGIALGVRLGKLLSGLYREFYRLPYLDFTLAADVLVLAVVVSVGSALLGAAVPVLRASRLPPAEAMRSDVPWHPWRALPGSGRKIHRLDQAHRLILRNLLQRPVRTLLTWFGLALGTAVMMMGRFQNDAVDQMVDRQFQRSQRHDISVSFVEPQAERALAELRQLPGVIAAEPERAVAVRVRALAASYRTALVGLPTEARLKRALDASGAAIVPPPRGVLLTGYLAGMLGLRPGDPVILETLESRRRTLQLPLAGAVSEPFGAQAYLPMASMNTRLGDGGRISGAVLMTDSAALPRLFDALERRPAIASISQRRVGISNFYESMAETILTFTLISTLFGMVITAGVVYSSARVALSERSRDLASLRILGFTRGEVSYLLLGELSLLAVLAIPLGFALGNGLIAMLIMGFDSDLFRIPHYVSPATYGIAGVTSLATVVLSNSVVRRRVSRLDLIAVLKARD